jgi:hypothetical protein
MYTQDIPVAQSLQWFGGQSALQTANPFAGHPSYLGFNNSNRLYEPESITADDGMSLLDSGLLSSLWMDGENTPNKTKNPFASNY